MMIQMHKSSGCTLDVLSGAPDEGLLRNQPLTAALYLVVAVDFCKQQCESWHITEHQKHHGCSSKQWPPDTCKAGIVFLACTVQCWVWLGHACTVGIAQLHMTPIRSSNFNARHTEFVLQWSPPSYSLARAAGCAHRYTLTNIGHP